MKYRVKTPEGELSYGSLRELAMLYRRQFIASEDLVRREDSEAWVRAGDMPDLREYKPRPALHGNEFAWLILAIAVGSLILLLLFKLKG